MIKFTVRGSKGDEYLITASREGEEFRITCTCDAAQNRLYCRHRISLLKGDVGAIISENEADVHKLIRLSSGTAVEKRLRTIKELEVTKEAIDSKLKSEKKALAREMTGSS